VRSLRIPIRIVFYRDEGAWIAHCLEFGLIGDGASRREALEQLGEAIQLQVQASVKHKNLANLFSPADAKLFEMFAAGRDVAEGELTLRLQKIDPVVIDRVEVREYADTDAVVA
jgi:predicted RNase H-like HicB family nuclease